MDNARECKCVCTSHAFLHISILPWASLGAQMVKNPPAMQETWVKFLGQEDPLAKGMATHSSILAWRIPWIEKPGRLQALGLQRVRHYWVANTFTFIYFYIYRKLWVLTNNSNLVFSLFQLWETQIPEALSVQSLLSSQILRCVPEDSPFSSDTCARSHPCTDVLLIQHGFWHPHRALKHSPLQTSCSTLRMQVYLGWPQLPPLFSPT